MGQTLQLTAADGHKLAAYRADPSGKPKGGVVVIQEIFGLNGHIRRVADGFAADGYVAIAPALFDRVKPGIELGYQEADIAAGIDIRAKVTIDQALADVDAARKAIASPLLEQGGKLGVVGYCWGGTLTWLSATRLDGFAAAAGYYGGRIGDFAEEKPRCAVQMHFGESDHAIPLADVGKLRAAQGANVEIQVYPAGHGFNCDERGSYHKPSADRARARVLAFFKEHVG
jgi:carboxymethylenebutenolidase